MLRFIAGVIAGFIVMVVLVFIGFAIPMAIMGFEGILQPNSYWTTTTFNIMVLAAGFVAALVGGMTCKAIARTSVSTMVLTVIVLIMGVASGVANMNKPDPPARPDFTTLEVRQQMELMQEHGKEPHWFAIVKPVLAVAGLLIGSSLVKGRKPSN